MSGTTRTSADLDPRRRRILYRCWHRGIREMDLVFGEFAENHISELSDAELDECFDCFDTEDFRIGYSAFLAKQKPGFVGR